MVRLQRWLARLLRQAGATDYVECRNHACTQRRTGASPHVPALPEPTEYQLTSHLSPPSIVFAECQKTYSGELPISCLNPSPIGYLRLISSLLGQTVILRSPAG